MIDWVCATDKTPMYVCELGRLRCSAFCNQHNNRIVNWKFDCGGRSGPHRNTLDLNSADYEGFTHAMAIGIVGFPEARAQWVMRLIEELDKQFLK